VGDENGDLREEGKRIVVRGFVGLGRGILAMLRQNRAKQEFSGNLMGLTCVLRACRREGGTI